MKTRTCLQNGATGFPAGKPVEKRPSEAPNAAHRRTGLRSSATALVALGVLALSLNAPAAQAEAESEATSTDTASFGVFGDLPYGIGETFESSVLEPYGVFDSQIDQIMLSPMAVDDSTPTTELDDPGPLDAQSVDTSLTSDTSSEVPSGIEASATATSSYSVITTWAEKRGWKVYLRYGYWNGSSGWGWRKVTAYHNLNTSAVKATTKYPKSYWSTGGTSWKYRTPVNHVKCSGWWIFRSCKVVETINVYTVVDFRKLSSGGTFGVVTGYCGSYYPRCPDWVKNAINI